MWEQVVSIICICTYKSKTERRIKIKCIICIVKVLEYRDIVQKMNKDDGRTSMNVKTKEIVKQDYSNN